MALIIFLLLPALGYASISIDIQAGPTRNQSVATDFGEDSSVITDQELAAFRITDRFLKKAAGLYSGGIPSDVFVKSPTPWGDLYKTYNWSEVKRETKVKNISIISLKTEEVILAVQKFINNGKKEALYSSNRVYNIENKVSKTFTGAKMAVDVKYNINLIVKDHPAMHIKFESGFGNETRVIDPKKLEANEVNVVVKPNQTVKVVTKSTLVTLGVVVNYETSLSGRVAVNYNPRYKGHHFWAYDIKEVVEAGNMPVVKAGADLITVKFHASAKVIATDSQSGSIILTEDAQYADYVTVQNV